MGNEIDFRECLPDECDTSEGSYSINLISCSQCTAEKTFCFWQEAINSTFLLAVQKNSVSYIVDEVHAFIICRHAFIVDPPHD